MHFESIAISHTFESDSILHGAIKRFCDYFDWLKISQIIVLMRKFHPIEVITKNFYSSVQNRLTSKSMPNSTTFKVHLSRSTSDIHHSLQIKNIKVTNSPF